MAAIPANGSVAHESVALEPVGVAACDSGLWGVRDFADEAREAVGIAAVIRTPNQAGFGGWGTSKPSMATLWLDASDPGVNDYVGMGWYVGSHSQLDYASQPRVFYIERDISKPQGYRRSMGPNLGWGTYHTMSIYDHNPGSEFRDYYYFLDGTFRGSTLILHQRDNKASFEGRVYNDCTDMNSRATKSASPYATLSYFWRDLGGSLHSALFTDTYFNNQPYYIYGINGPATALGWGPG